MNDGLGSYVTKFSLLTLIKERKNSRNNLLKLEGLNITWTMTRFGVPAAVDGWIPDPVREFFLAVMVTTLARVLEVGRWEEVVVEVAEWSSPEE